MIDGAGCSLQVGGDKGPGFVRSGCAIQDWKQTGVDCQSFGAREGI